MRNFILLLLFTMPPLVACGAAYAKTSVEIGKPVCTHYDDATKPEQPATSAGVAAPASSTAIANPAVATTAPSTANAASAATKQKSGGTSSMMRPHDAPRWQTFLPGMFK
jgi:hypothetical protein